MQFISSLFMKGRKFWSFGKAKKVLIWKIGIRTVNDIFISKLQIPENHREKGVPENSKDVYDVLQNKRHKDNSMLIKVIWMYNLWKVQPESNVLKGKCKKKDLKFFFRSFIARSCWWILQQVAGGCTFHNLLTGASPT